MKAVLVVLTSLLTGVMAQSTVPCSGVVTCDPTSAVPSSPTTTPAGDDSGQHGGYEFGSGMLPPSPTNSGECHSQGDHWHCGGASETGEPASVGRIEAGMAAVVAFAVLGM